MEATGEVRHLSRLSLVAPFAYIAIVGAGLVYTRNWPTSDQVALALLLFAVVIGRARAFVRDWSPFVLLIFAYEALAAYAAESVQAGASGIFFAPLAWASRDSCSEDFYREFGRPYDLQVLDAVTSAPFNVLHVCRSHNILMRLLDYPVAAFNWADRGEGNPTLGDVRALTSRGLLGGIDHVRLDAMAPDEVAAQAREALAVGTGVVLTAGCAIPPDTPAANRAAVASAPR
jgi:uroporphyrinogen-III decarboxylase